MQTNRWVTFDNTVDPSSYFTDSKVHGANMGLTWGRQDPGGPHVGPMNLTIWVVPHSGNWTQSGGRVSIVALLHHALHTE